MTCTAPGSGRCSPRRRAAAALRPASCDSRSSRWDRSSSRNEDCETIAFSVVRPSTRAPITRPENTRNETEWRRARCGEGTGRSACRERRGGFRRTGSVVGAVRALAGALAPTGLVRAFAGALARTGAVRALAGALARTGAVRAFAVRDRKSTRLNSSHITISYAVFCLKKKKKKKITKREAYEEREKKN